MNLEKLQEKLIAAARTASPDQRVPYAFEKRVMTRVNSRVAADPSALWATALWRAAAPCLAIMLFFSAWSLFGPGSASSGDLGQDFESTVLAAADQESTADLL